MDYSDVGKLKKANLSDKRLNLLLVSGLLCERFIEDQMYIQQDSRCTDEATFAAQGLLLLDYKPSS